MKPTGNNPYLTIEALEEGCNIGSEPFRIFIQDIEVHENGTDRLVQGVFYDEVGSQRKGMSRAFNERFQREAVCLWANEEDFEFAWSCVMADSFYEKTVDPETIRLTKEAFKRDFCDSFVFGQSILFTTF